MSRDTAGLLLVEALNSVVRKHKRKFQRERTLPAAAKKPPVSGAAGVAYGATPISA